MPTNTSEPIPAASKSRQQDDGKRGSPEAGGFDDDDRADDRGPEQRGDGRELAAAAIRAKT